MQKFTAGCNCQEQVVKKKLKIKKPLFLSFFLDIRSVSGVGDASRQHTRAQRQQVRRHERLQRRYNVHHRGGDQFCTGRQAGRHVHHAVGFHNILQYRHVVPRFCAEGKKKKKKKKGSE